MLNSLARAMEDCRRPLASCGRRQPKILSESFQVGSLLVGH